MTNTPKNDRSTRRYHPGYECKWATNTAVSYTHLTLPTT